MTEPNNNLNPFSANANPNPSPNPWSDVKEVHQPIQPPAEKLEKNILETNPAPGEFEVHTMKDDLENLKNPSALKYPGAILAPAQSAPYSPQKKAENFLSQAHWEDKKAGFEKDKLVLEQTAEDKKTGGGKGLWIGIIIVAVIGLAAGGAYYYWLTQIKNKSTTQNIPASTTPALSENSPAQTNLNPADQNLFSAENPNYLSVDMANIDSAGLKNTLADYASKVSAQNATTPIEFVITDSKNNPIAFQDFALKLGLGLPINILSQMGPNFFFFIYNDNGNTGYGLDISSVKNSDQLKASLTKEELNLTHDLAPFFPLAEYTLAKTPFSSSVYNGNAIRYNNIVLGKLSLDYTIKNNQLIIGTTKQSLRSIIDHLNEQTADTPSSN